jgi:hypothetical protein
MVLLSTSATKYALDLPVAILSLIEADWSMTKSKQVGLSRLISAEYIMIVLLTPRQINEIPADRHLVKGIFTSIARNRGPLAGRLPSDDEAGVVGVQFQFRHAQMP